MAERPPPMSPQTLCEQAYECARVGEPDRALRLARIALEKDANCFPAHLLIGILLSGQSKHTEACDALCHAVRLQPHDPWGHYHLALVLQQLGRLQEALWAMESAATLSKGETRIRAAFVELRNRAHIQGLPALGVIPVAGRMPLWWRAVNSVYLLLLSVLSVGFYGLVAAIVAASFAGGILIAYAIITTLRSIYAIQIAIAVGAAFCSFGVMVVQSLAVITRPFELGGVQKTRDELPRLWRVLDEVAHRVGAPRLDALYLDPFSNAGVREVGGWLGLPFGATRTLNLGVGLVEQLTLPELKSLLAHEFAHFSHQDPAWSRLLNSVAERLFQVVANIYQETNWRLNPAYWIMLGYLTLYGLAVSGFRRRREYWADRMAAMAYGGSVAGAMLEKTFDATLSDQVIRQWTWEAGEQDQSIPNVYTAWRAASATLSHHDRKRMRQDLVKQQPKSLFDTHPPLRDRMKRVKPVAADLPNSLLPGILVFENPQAIEEEMSVFIASEVGEMQSARIARPLYT